MIVAEQFLEVRARLGNDLLDLRKIYLETEHLYYRKNVLEDYFSASANWEFSEFV